MLGRLEVVVASSTIHHHLVELGLRVLSIDLERLMFQVFWILVLFMIWRHLEPDGVVVSFLAFARHDTGLFNLFMFQDMHEHHSCHMGIVACLVVV